MSAITCSAFSGLDLLRVGPYPIENQRIRFLEESGWTIDRIRLSTAYEIDKVRGIGWLTACLIVANLREKGLYREGDIARRMRSVHEGSRGHTECGCPFEYARD